MRISASKTGLALVYGVACCAASCAQKPAPLPRELQHDPPARLLAVTDEGVTLRANAWIELHASLAAAARDDNVPPDGAGDTPEAPPLGPAAVAYARTLAHDDEDGLLDATLHALTRCTDDACALGVLEPTGFAGAFARALPPFLAHDWAPRARIAWAGIELAHVAMGPRALGILDKVVQNLGTTIGPVDIVSESPTAGEAALLTPALTVRGPCFDRPPVLDTDVQNARLMDCVLVRAVLAGDAPLRATLGERLWTVVVVHTVASLVTRLEPRHASVDRRAVAIAAPEMLDFVTTELHSGQVSPELGRRWRERSSAPSDSASH